MYSTIFTNTPTVFVIIYCTTSCLRFTGGLPPNENTVLFTGLAYCQLDKYSDVLIHCVNWKGSVNFYLYTHEKEVFLGQVQTWLRSFDHDRKTGELARRIESFPQGEESRSHDSHRFVLAGLVRLTKPSPPPPRHRPLIRIPLPSRLVGIPFGQPVCAPMRRLSTHPARPPMLRVVTTSQAKLRSRIKYEIRCYRVTDTTAR